MTTGRTAISISHDLHCHSRISTCATEECTLERLIDTAAETGLALLGISDHVHGEDALRLADIQAQRERVKAGAWPVEVWIGAELSQWAPGKMPVRQEIRGQFDYILISTNHFGVPNVEGPREWTAAAVADWLLAGFAAAIEERPLAVSHPFLHGYELHVPAGEVLAALDRKRIRECFARAADLRVAVELNARKVRKAPPFYAELMRLARGTGLHFTLGSDSHSAEEMAYGGRFGREEFAGLLTLIGLRPEQVWTREWWEGR